MSKIYFKLALPYLLSFLFYLFGPVYFSPPGAKFLFIISLCVILFVFFSNLSFKVILNGEYSVVKSINLDIVVIYWFKLISPLVLISSFVYVFLLLKSGLSFNLTVEETSFARSLVGSSSFGKKVCGFFAFQCYSFVPLIFSGYRNKFSKLVQLLYLVSIFLMGYAVILQAGRTFFLIVIFIIYALCIISPLFIKNVIKKKFVFLLFVLFFLIFSSFFVYKIGVQRPGFSELNYTYINSKLRYGDFFLQNQPLENIYFFISIFQYYAGPLSNLNKQIEAESDICRISFGPLASVVYKFNSPINFRSKSELQSIVKYLALGGQATGWRTGYGNMTIWYGLLGSIFLSSLLGFYVTKKIVLFHKFPGIYNFLSANWILIFFFNCMFYFPVDSIFGVNFFIVYLFIPFISNFLNFTFRIKI